MNPPYEEISPAPGTPDSGARSVRTSRPRPTADLGRVYALLIANLLTGMLCAGCASTPAPQSTDTSKKERREPEAPAPDELAESPCANPDWGQLPEQHAIDGDPDSPDESGGESDEEAPESTDEGDESPAGDSTSGSSGDQ